MADAGSLPHRLTPDPAEIHGMLVGAFVGFSMAGMILYGTGLAPRPELWAALGFSLLVGGGLAVAAFRRARRVRSGRVPVLEVDTQPWRPGQRHQLRLLMTELPPLVALDASLEALDWVRVDPSSTSDTFSHQVPVHSSSLLRLSGDELQSARAEGRLDRTVEVLMPMEAATRQWLWGIRVRGASRALTPFTERMLEKMQRRQAAHLPVEARETVLHEVRRGMPRGAGLWEYRYRLQVDGPS